MNKQERIEAVAKFICDYENENPDCTTRDLAKAIEEAVEITNHKIIGIIDEYVWNLNAGKYDHIDTSNRSKILAKLISQSKDIIKIQPKGNE